MAAAAISISIQLASVLMPQVVVIWKAIAALRAQGVSEENIQALLNELASDVKKLDAQAVALMAGILLPDELPK